jgi:large subunit ribosomal protein L25
LIEQLVFSLSIEAKPQDIPNSIEHDIAALEIGDQLRASELALPSGVTATVEGDVLVAQVVAPRVEVEEVVEGEAGAEGEEGVEGEEGATEASSGDGEGGGEGGEG